jgi:DNA repair protein RecO (recombination protein O)
MQIKTQGIILSNVKYGDKKVISKIYTRNFGLRTFIIHYGTSSKSKIRLAHLQPLNQVELEIVAKEKNEVNRVTEIKVLFPYREINFHVLKNCIAGFINEALIKTLKEAEPDEEIYEFVSSSLRELDELSENYSSYHLYFLTALTTYFGFFPLDNYDSQHPFFNLMDGRFEHVPPVHMNSLDRQDSRIFSELLKYYQSFATHPVAAADRSTMLNLLIRYYYFHIPNFTDFRTLPVLQATLHS